MKIKIDKIGLVPVRINRYINEELFSFSLDLPPNFYQRKLNDFDKVFAAPESSTKKFLTHKLSGNWLPPETTVEEIMSMNFNHIFRATEYFTNGQKIASLLDTGHGYEIAFHNDIKVFEGYFWPAATFAQFSISSFRTETFKVYEKAIAEIIKYLSKIEIIRISIDYESKGGFLEIKAIHPLGYVFKLDGNEVYKEVDIANSLDRITQDISEWVKPNVLKCCLKCVNFAFSGMSHDMSGGASGYCSYIMGKAPDADVRQSITHIWSVCDKFEVTKTR